MTLKTGLRNSSSSLDLELRREIVLPPFSLNRETILSVSINRAEGMLTEFPLPQKSFSTVTRLAVPPASRIQRLWDRHQNMTPSKEKLEQAHSSWRWKQSGGPVT